MFTRIRPLIGLIAGALLVGGAAATAFADTGVVHSTEDGVSATAVIVKELQMPEGTTVPAVTFTFNVTPISSDGDTNVLPPSLFVGNTTTVVFTEGDPSTPPSGGNWIATKNSGDLFASNPWQHAGIYVYQITEQDMSIPFNTVHQKMYYSNAVYSLKVAVKADKTDKHLYVSWYTMVQGTVLNDNPNLDTKVASLKFTNTYIETNGPGNPDTPNPEVDSNATLYIKKLVALDYADETLYFDFQMSLTPPALLKADDTPAYYRAYVVSGTSVADTTELAKNADSSLIKTDTSGTYIMVSTTVPTNFKLKHGQKLVFIDTPVGTRYTVSETHVSPYTTKVEIRTAAGTPLEITTDADAGTPAFDTGSQLVGSFILVENVKTFDNHALFTNSYQSVNATGLIINNLPFLGLIVLAGGALVAFVIVKSRKVRATK